MSLITIVANVAASVNVVIPTSIIGSTQADALQWLILAKRAGEEVASRHDWQALVVAHTWTSAATEPQPDALPSDYDHLVPDVEVWDRTSNTRFEGPVSSAVWQQLQSSGVTGGVSGWWRIIGGVLNIYPAPAAGSTFALDYVSKNWAENSMGTDKATWTVDTDVARVPEELIELGLTWRWLRAKGMDYAEELATYERELEKAAARDRGIGVMVVRRRDGPTSWQGTIIP